MIKKATLFAMLLLIIFKGYGSQAIQKPDSIVSYKKATYLNGDLAKLLSNNTRYPSNEMMNRVEGDIVFSFVINKNGKLESLSSGSLSNISLFNSANVAMKSLDGDWIPAMINNVPADKKYLIIFRFRTYVDSRPYSFKSQARRLYEKQKYEKALKLYNEGIKENRYDFELFEFRSKVKQLLGDTEGSKTDQSVSLDLQNEIMLVIDIISVSIRRTVKTGSRIVAVPQM